MKAKRTKTAGPAIPIDQWIDALEEVGETQRDDGLTSEELAEAWGVCRDSALSRVKKLHRAGCVTVGKRPAMSLDGKPYMQPVYQLTKGKQ